MEFGKPDNPALVDWSLAEDSDLTNHYLGSKHTTQPFKAYVGSTAWGNKEWLGSYYPLKTKAADYLKAYGQQFGTIELNTTFYRIPTPDQVRTWAAKVPDDFRFCPKVNRMISQSRTLGIGTSALPDFIASVQCFGNKLGPCFMQLPPTFSIEKRDAISRFLAAWPSTIRLAIEFRHESWFRESASLDVFAELLHAGVGMVITDVGARRDVSHGHLTAPFVLLRWVGTHHETDVDRIKSWTTKANRWSAAGIEEFYIFAHQPHPIASAESATHFAEHLLSTGMQADALRYPTVIVEKTPPKTQISLFD